MKPSNPFLYWRHYALFYVCGPLAVGAGLAMIGPYGTYGDLAFPNRLIYWTTIVIVNWAQVSGFCCLFLRLLPPPQWPLPVGIVLAACAASLLATPEVIYLEQWMRPGVRTAATI